jgi:hypothetical protein
MTRAVHARTDAGFSDARQGRIVFVSQCILNQNLRFPGIALFPGACADVVDLFVKSGIGIEPIPCMERLGWGGVSRKGYFRYQPLILRYAGTPYFRLVRPLVRLWLYRYRLRCARHAKAVVRYIRDYVESGYTVIGIVAVNDSPTDGVTRTIDLVGAAERLAAGGVDPGVMNDPNLKTMARIMPLLCTQGTGILTARFMRELKRKKTYVKIVGYDPWADPAAETERIAAELGL